MYMKILVKFPTFNRPKQFYNTLYEYYKKANNKNDMHFLISIDECDVSMNTETVLNGLKSYPNLEVVIGDSKSKIDAVNRDLEKTEYKWDILLLASDDMVPMEKGYDDIIRNDMKEYFSDLDGVLWYNDGHQKDALNTLCILGKKYYERFNYIYYPEYKSGYCDNEFTKVSKILNKVKYFDRVIIEHQHPDWGYGQNDIIHSNNYKNLSFDKNLFVNREKNNFYIN